MPDRLSPAQSRGSHWGGLFLLWACIVLPMVWVMTYSALYSLGIGSLLSNGITLRYWCAAFATGGLKESLIYSLLIAGSVTSLAVVGSLSFTLLFPHVRNNAQLLAILCIPLATPSAVMAIMAYQLLNPGGYLARLAFHWGWIETPTQFPVLVNDNYAVGIIVTQVCGALPLLTLFFLKTWTSCRADHYCRLAEALGASPMQARLQIAMPMLLRRGRMLVLLLFLLNLGSYEVPLLLGRQSPQMFSVMTQRHFGQYHLEQRPEAFVMATSYLLLVALGVFVMLRWRRRHAGND